MWHIQVFVQGGLVHCDLLEQGAMNNEKLPSPVKGLPICSSLWMLQETPLY